MVLLRKGRRDTQPAKDILVAVLLAAEGCASRYLPAFGAAGRLEDWQRLLDLAKEDTQAEAAVVWEASRDRWHKWCTSQLYVGRLRVYRWVRQGTLRGLSGTLRTLPPGQAREVQKLHSFWMSLWKPSADDPNPELTAWLVPLRTFAPFPAVHKLSLVTLRNVVRRTAKNKASGADGRAYSERANWSLGFMRP